MLAVTRANRADRFGANRPETNQSMANNGATRILSTAKADQRCRKEDGSTALDAEAVAKGGHSTLLIRTARVGTLDGGDEQGDRQGGDIAECDEARFGRRPLRRALVLQDEGHLQQHTVFRDLPLLNHDLLTLDPCSSKLFDEEDWISVILATDIGRLQAKTTGGHGVVGGAQLSI